MNLNIKNLFESGAHYGHQTRRWSPKMAPYIYGARAGIHIIDLDKTMDSLRQALPMLANIYAHGNKILFVGTKRSCRDALKHTAIELDLPHVTKRWLGGTLTNYKTIRHLIRRLFELEGERDNGQFQKISKKEALGKTREIEKLENSIGGIRHMGGLPDAIFVVDVEYERTAVAEARRLGIPVFGFVDTNTDPQLADVVIPINDDSSKTTELVLSELVRLCKEARQNQSQNDLSQNDIPQEASAEATEASPQVAEENTQEQA